MTDPAAKAAARAARTAEKEASRAEARYARAEQRAARRRPPEPVYVAAAPPAPLKRPTDLHETDRRPRRSLVPGPRIQQWMIVVLLVAGGCSFVVKGADKPADPFLQSEGRRPIQGFGEIAYRVNRAPNASRCAMLAQTADQQAQGLMNQTDLHGYDGMLFLFDSDTDTAFYMKDTPLPLTIAWFDSGGRFVSSTDMEPCLNKPTCPTYSAASRYRYALEVPRGGLDALSIGPGAVISVGGPCA